MRRAGVLTVSDRSYLALRADTTGPLIADRLHSLGFDVARREIVPDDRARIAGLLRQWSEEHLDLVLTTGGTGLARRDETPEATNDVAHRVVPGICEWIRTATSARHPFASLSRGIAVVRDSTLIINLPGSPRGVNEYLDHLEKILDHALGQISQRPDFGPSLPHLDRSAEQEES
ncbi:MAG: MogA/MoaB family molybdenum cofactor biosynthesis protein [Candidatus Eisenbacteria bacterium]